MFNNVVLDVFIGLVLIYLLYSLFVTIIGEMVATWMCLRSRILRVSIEKMLNDGYYKSIDRHKYSGLWHFLQRYFLKEFPDFKNSPAGKFYSYPSIKYLSQKAAEHKTPFTQTKPSYISADVFADTLIQMLKDKGTGATDMDKVNLCLQFNTHHLQLATLKHLRDMAADAGTDIDVFKEKIKKWYNETQDRATGWYKRKLQLMLFWMGFIIVATFNVDTIKIIKLLSKDRDARNQLVTMGIELSKDSARYSDFIKNNGDSVHAQAIVDSGFARIQKDISDANMVLGLGWGANKLLKSKDCELDSAEDKRFFKLVEEQRNAFGTLKKTHLLKQAALQYDLAKIDSVNQRIKDLAIDTVYVSDAVKNATLLKIDSAQKSLQRFKNQKGRDSFLLVITAKQLRSVSNIIDSATGNEFAVISSVNYKRGDDGKENKGVLVIRGKRTYGALERGWYIFYNSFTPRNFIGLFLTALMLSLGAPFWFDLLKKLVAIRGSGVKPEEKVQKEEPTDDETILAGKKNNAPPAPAAGPVPSGDVYEAALKLFAPAIKKIPGVKSVVKGFQNNSDCVQVNVADAVADAEVKKQFATLKIGNTTLTPVVVISGLPVTHQANTGTISNSSGLNGAGSLGCILKEKDTNLFHVLSCWHVLKGDTNYDADDKNDIILDDASKNLAQRWAGGIRGSLDFSIAQCLPGASIANNTFLKVRLGLASGHSFKLKPVSDKDVNNRIAIKYYDCISAVPAIKQGIIFTDADEVEINYADKARVIQDVLVLTDTVQSQQTITQPGNSGSIVFDAGNNPIAMIIGGDSKYTYAVKLSNIFSIHDEMTFA